MRTLTLARFWLWLHVKFSFAVQSSSNFVLLDWTARDIGCFDNNCYHTTIFTKTGRY